MFVLRGSAEIGGGCTEKDLYRRGGRAQLLLGGGISTILLVLFMLTSFRLARLCSIVRQSVVAERRFFFSSAQTNFSMETIRFAHSFCMCFVRL